MIKCTDYKLCIIHFSTVFIEVLCVCCKRIDATEDDGSLGRLVNDDHRRPNCVMKLVEVDGAPHVCLFALVDMTPCTELRYNYGKGAYPWRTKVSAVVSHFGDDGVTDSFPIRFP